MSGIVYIVLLGKLRCHCVVMDGLWNCEGKKGREKGVLYMGIMSGLCMTVGGGATSAGVKLICLENKKMHHHCTQLHAISM